MPVEAGQVIAERYRLVRPIGKGAQASVWIAEHLALGSQVAVKLMDPELMEVGDARERFRREAAAAAQLRSAHVVQILDHGIDGKQPFMVMELLDGEDLFQRLERKNRLSLVEASSIVTQIARALARAHAQGIVHRDLKPENVYLVPNEDDEIAKVLDFGVAKFLDATSVTRRTSAGTLLGTPHYMSPEQVRGVGEIDHRSDLWSLGVIAYQLTVGDMPFESEGVGDLLIKITMEKIPVPSRTCPDLPRSFDEWFARACHRDVEQRFQTARELAEALARVAGLVAPPVDSMRGGTVAAKGRSEPPAFDVDFDEQPSLPPPPPPAPAARVPAAAATPRTAPVAPRTPAPPVARLEAPKVEAPKVEPPKVEAKEDIDDDWPDEPPESTTSVPPPAVAPARATPLPRPPATPAGAARKASDPKPDAKTQGASPAGAKPAATPTPAPAKVAAVKSVPPPPPRTAEPATTQAAAPAEAAPTAPSAAPAPVPPAPAAAEPAPAAEAPRAPAPPPPPKPAAPVQAAPPPAPRAATSDPPPRSKSSLSSTISGASGDVIPPPELDGSRKRRALTYLVIAAVLGAGGIAIAVVRSHDVVDPRPAPATTGDPVPTRAEPEVVAPPPAADPSPATSASGAASSDVMDPGQSKRPIKTAPSSSRPAAPGGPRRPRPPPKDGEIVIEVPLPDREVPVPPSP